MKHFSILLFFLICQIGSSQSVEKIVLDEEDETSGYYLAVVPAGNKVEGVLVLLLMVLDSTPKLFFPKPNFIKKHMKIIY
ncbi:hypothetical protein [Zobellia laminariae]|uniref:hypothetical protein n=1 Tax=Zobellia laminariae TaxID=248906 RepID=UPI0026F43928|nr:hypothetical protein [Zobellia laminariae]WKX77393.1 hypothetical protein Q5W13_04865 [Zobellia laminariae]